MLDPPPLPTALLAQPHWGPPLALRVGGSGVDVAGQAWEGTCPRSCVVTQLLPALHCGTVLQNPLLQ